MSLSGLNWEDQCIFSTQSEIGLFPTGEESLYRATLFPRAERALPLDAVSTGALEGGALLTRAQADIERCSRLAITPTQL